MLIAVDAMGGDHAPRETVRGALLAAQRSKAGIALVGLPDALDPLLSREDRALVDIVPAGSVVAMDESPAKALRARPDSSLAIAVNMVAEGKAAAVVSAGNSGAFMAIALTRLGRIAGVTRPAIAIPLPTRRGERVCLDAGANVDCHPEHLAQFAILGSVYCQQALSIPQPRVGLLSIGTEQIKGNELTRQAYELLHRTPVNFVGYVEGNHIFDGEVDVIVCDGFVGNVLLKAGEGLASLILSELRDRIRRSALAKLGLLFMYPALRQMRQRFDYSHYGGALLLGVRGICVVCHGRSNAQAIANAILVAERAVRSGVVNAVAEACERMNCIASPSS